MVNAKEQRQGGGAAGRTEGLLELGYQREKERWQLNQ